MVVAFESYHRVMLQLCDKVFPTRVCIIDPKYFCGEYILKEYVGFLRLCINKKIL